MATAAIAAVGLTAGLHGALYGAYKDSPHESFLIRRFVREIVIALSVALGLAFLHEAARRESLFVLYVSIFALTRTATEFWEAFRARRAAGWISNPDANSLDQRHRSESRAPVDPWLRVSVLNLWHLRARRRHPRRLAR